MMTSHLDGYKFILGVVSLAQTSGFSNPKFSTTTQNIRTAYIGIKQGNGSRMFGHSLVVPLQIINLRHFSASFLLIWLFLLSLCLQERLIFDYLIVFLT
jgi:hypothetical protein